jgi:cytochrome c oxidase assembly protein subunit 15
VVARRETAAIDGALTLAIAITIQAAFGVITLLHQTPIALSLTHQGMAMVVLTIAVVHAHRLSARNVEVDDAALSSAPNA